MSGVKFNLLFANPNIATLIINSKMKNIHENVDSSLLINFNIAKLYTKLYIIKIRIIIPLNMFCFFSKLYAPFL